MDNFKHLIEGIGLWAEVLSRDNNLQNKSALFLDRDGVIIVIIKGKYIRDFSEFEF